MIAGKIVGALFMSAITFGVACFLGGVIIAGAKALTKECSHWFPVLLVYLIAAKMAALAFVVWFALSFAIWGRIWFEVSGPANVPHWALVLFSDGK